MEKEKVNLQASAESVFNSLISSKKQEKKIETEEEYKKRLLLTEENDSESINIDWEKEILNEFNRSNVACINKSFVSPNVKHLRWFKFLSPITMLISIMGLSAIFYCWSESVFFLKSFLVEDFLVNNINEIKKLMSILSFTFLVVSILPITVGFIALMYNLNKCLKLEIFKKYCEKELQDYEDGAYNISIGSYLYKKYNKKGDDKFNIFLLSEIGKNESLKTKMYEYNHPLFKKEWSKEIEVEYIKKILKKFKERN